MNKAIQTTPAGPCVHYQRLRPEETTLYRLVQEHAESFFAQVERETGAGLPSFISIADFGVAIPKSYDHEAFTPIRKTKSLISWKNIFLPLRNSLILILFLDALNRCSEKCWLNFLLLFPIL